MLSVRAATLRGKVSRHATPRPTGNDRAGGAESCGRRLPALLHVRSVIRSLTCHLPGLCKGWNALGGVGWDGVGYGGVGWGGVWWGGARWGAAVRRLHPTPPGASQHAPRNNSGLVEQRNNEKKNNTIKHSELISPVSYGALFGLAHLVSPNTAAIYFVWSSSGIVYRVATRSNNETIIGGVRPTCLADHASDSHAHARADITFRTSGRFDLESR